MSILVLYAHSTPTHSAEQVGEITSSRGWTAPAPVDEAGTIVAGHEQVPAARRPGIAEVSVIVPTG